MMLTSKGRARDEPVLDLREPAAFEAFYREQLPFIRSYLARRVDAPLLVAELTAEVFLQVIRSARSYQPALGPPRAWLTGIARHLLSDRRRSGARENATHQRLQGRRLLDEDSAERIVQRTDLDPFETALLSELRATLARAAPAARRTPARSRLVRRRWTLTGVGVAAAASTVALLVPGLGPTPAYAVTGGEDGEVHVEVNQLEGAEGLERALADHGIHADITYLPEGKECAASPRCSTDWRNAG